MSDLGKVITEEEFAELIHGSQSVFRKVFDSYRQLIYSYIVSYCKDEAEAEELVQEAFTQLFIHRAKIRDAEGIYPYLFVIAKRLTISNFKRKVVRSKYLNHLGGSWTEESQDTQLDLDATELWSLLQKVVNTLPTRQQEVYRLNVFENLSYQEIADRIGLTRSTVKNNLVEATKKVRWKLSKIYGLVFSLFIFFLD